MHFRFTAHVCVRRISPVACTLLSLMLGSVPAVAQNHTGSVIGHVTADDGAPAANIGVRLGADRTAVTNANGDFQFTGVPAGAVMVAVDAVGWRPLRVPAVVRAGEATHVALQLQARALLLDELVVTTSREAESRAQTPASVHAVTAADIERLTPAHPSELLNRVPGVWVNVTSGEGYMAAIRHPLTTNPVYLYLENGVPTRPTGFFNHNALYEVDVPHAGRIEVVKGPATALYGSDAIGGMINVLSHSTDEIDPLSLSLEAGAYGFGRGLVSGRLRELVAELNLTRTAGWRDGTGYDRQSGTLRWEHTCGASSLRSMITFSRIDQNTAGTSAISAADFRSAPTRNYTPISYRDVDALRASVAWEHLSDNALLSVTPFVRWNRMEMLPNWTLTFDPYISRTGYASAGTLLKIRRDYAPARTRAIAGLDLDYSPGTHREWAVTTTREGDVFTDYTRAADIYDYEVTFRSVSPYLQVESSPLADVRLTAGVRYDALGYDYHNRLGELQQDPHRRPASTELSYQHFSPKLGITWAPTAALRAFASYGHGFRAPSEAQLFRQGRALNSLGLHPVRADNFEVGVGGLVGDRLHYDVAVYHMRKFDDIVTFTHTDGATETANAGETLHRGVEAGLAIALPHDVRLDATLSLAAHRYERWTPQQGVDFNGKAMESAPNHTASAALSWMPKHWRDTSFGIEAQHIGPFWMDAGNTLRYDGHTLVTLRAEAPVLAHLSAFGRVTNLFDERYAEMAQYTTARGAEYAPGMPRSFYIGMKVR